MVYRGKLAIRMWSANHHFPKLEYPFVYDVLTREARRPFARHPPLRRRRLNINDVECDT